MSNSESFRSQAENKLGANVMVDHSRTKFKLDAARHFLLQLKQLNAKAGSLVSSDISRFDVELNLDAFLYEVVGTIDPLLQEINVAFQLGIKPWEVQICSVTLRLPTGGQLRKTLNKHDGDTTGWFWKLREYRNHSAHRTIIGFYIAVTVGGNSGNYPTVYLHKDPRDPNSGRGDEQVVEYCENSLKRMEELIDELYGLCAAEL